MPFSYVREGEDAGRVFFCVRMWYAVIILSNEEGEARLFLSNVGTKKVRSLVHYSFLPFFLAPHKKEFA